MVVILHTLHRIFLYVELKKNTGAIAKANMDATKSNTLYFKHNIQLLNALIVLAIAIPV